MALFAYKAIDPRGKTMLGQIEAINLVDLELRLKRMGLDLVRGGPTRHGGRLLRSGGIKRGARPHFFLPLWPLLAPRGALAPCLLPLPPPPPKPRTPGIMSGGLQPVPRHTS